MKPDSFVVKALSSSSGFPVALLFALCCFTGDARKLINSFRFFETGSYSALTYVIFHRHAGE